MKRIFFLTAAMSALALAACGDDAEVPEASETPQMAEQGKGGGGTVPAAFTSPDLPASTGDQFLTDFAARENTMTTESGLVVETIEEGSGAQPAADDLVKIHFVARVAGQADPFESTYEEDSPVVLQLSETLPGWAEALQTARAGAKIRAAVPPSLAFGAQGMPNGPVGPNAVTVFDMELLEVYDAQDDAALAAVAEEAKANIEELTREAQVAQGLAQQQFSALQTANLARSNLFLQEVAQRENVQRTESGLLYEVVEDGGEGESPSIGDVVKVNYRGTVPSGEVFDSSYDRGEPTSFELGKVIEGWNEGLQLMNPGDTYRFYIPAELAYGPAGTRNALIGPNQALVFDVELIEVGDAPAQQPQQQ